MRMRFHLLTAGVLILVSAVPFRPAAAQAPPSPIAPDQPDMKVDSATRNSVIEALLDAIVKDYVYPETAGKMKEYVLARKAAGDFDRLTSARAFADSLTASLQAVSHDKHLRVRYSHDVLPVRKDGGRLDPAEAEKMQHFMSLRNYGFEKADRLPGNVGYLDLRSFSDGTEATETAVHAMNFLSNVDALIIDLRQNGGGSPEMVQLISTYLYAADERIHLNDLYFRPADETTQYWTLPHVPGKRLAGQDVYILTSGRTFSAAEEFTYNLKNLKRATIVGETTGGGAHPGDMRRLDDHFDMFVATGRAINPITKTNWEGTGVEPDIAVPAEEALKTAHLAALRKLLQNAASPDEKQRLEMAIQMVDSPDAPALPVIRRRAG
jgi:hypothetical protein